MNENEIRRMNEKFLFERKQKLEELEERCDDSFCSYSSSLANLIKEYTWEPLMFKFGKYKGLIVDIVMEIDRSYILWFQENVQGLDYETLKLKDYVSFKLRSKDYYISNVYEVGNKVAKELYKDKVTDEEIKEYIDKKFYNKRSYNSYYEDDEEYCPHWLDYDGDLYDAMQGCIQLV